MKLSFKTDYQSTGKETLLVAGSSAGMGEWNTAKALPMERNASGEWEAFYEGPFSGKLEYKYFLVDSEGLISWEGGKPRNIDADEHEFEEIHVRDFWRTPKDPDIPLHSSAFTKALMRRDKSNGTNKSNLWVGRILRIQVTVPLISPQHCIAVLGDQPVIGDWIEERALVMDDSRYPVWKIDIPADQIKFPVQFKYCIYDTVARKVLSWEGGSNRTIRDFVCKSPKSIKIHTDEKFRFQTAQHWRGTGVAVPLFSLRTEISGGIGEYPDLMKLVDWARETGMKMIQLLPVNDTIATHTWTDTYPYKSISSIALNPDYININKIGILDDENLLIGFMKALSAFNAMNAVHYEEVHKVKAKFFRFIYEQQAELINEDPSYRKFIEENREWLIPYAAFCFLRDKYNSADFNKWPEYSKFDQKEIEELSSPGKEDYLQISIHYFIQYQAHKQFLEAAEYARLNRIVLKGDLPIGISPHSVDVWTHPEWFNTGEQTGAPPDDFSDLGQNWGFPSYRWEKMAEDGYTWWIKRLKHMSAYFDVVRFDHIQGYFRIWEIPFDQVQGVLGHFNPALPFARDEIIDRGILFNEERFTKPYIREYFLHEIFGSQTEEVKVCYLKEYEPGKYDLRKGFQTQREVWKYFEENKTGADLTLTDIRIRDGLCFLISEVIFLRDPVRPFLFHPRFDLQNTNSYLNMESSESRACLDELYQEFLFSKHEEIWRKQAMKILPALINSTEMLVCGEDLGITSECVREVMRELSILSLEIQRMPANSNDEFSDPSDAPWLSVCSTSTHDTSTLRGWWEEERAATKRFFKFFDHNGDYPETLEPWLAREIINQHLLSPAMWAVFPIQDILAMDEELRYKNIGEERINVPSIAQNYWRYRMHITLEDLLSKTSFNTEIKSLIDTSGRGRMI